MPASPGTSATRSRPIVNGTYGHVDGQLLQTSFFNTAIPIFADNPVRAGNGVRALLPAGQNRRSRPALPPWSGPTALRVHDGTPVRRFRARLLHVGQQIPTAPLRGISGTFGGGLGVGRLLPVQPHRSPAGGERQPGRGCGHPPRDRPEHHCAEQRLSSTSPPTRWSIRRPASPTCRALLSPDPALRAAAAGCTHRSTCSARTITARLPRTTSTTTLVEDIRLEQHVVAGERAR